MKLAEKKGASQAEAYMSRMSELQTNIENKQVKISEKKYDAGVGVRLALKKQGGFSVGFAFSTDFTKEALTKTVKLALKVASFKKIDENFKSFQEGKSIFMIEKIYDHNIASMEPEEVVDFANDLIQMSSVDKRIRTINGMLSFGIENTAILNSLDVCGEFEATSYEASTLMIAQKNDSVAVGWDDYFNCFYNEDKTHDVFETAADIALRQLHPKRIKTEKMDLLMQPHALTYLLAYTLIQEVRADIVQKQQSPLLGKIGEMVGSRSLTIIDDGHVPQSIGSRPFDDEGCPTQVTPVIEKGQLKSFLHNSYSANVDNIASTGNAVRVVGSFITRSSYGAEPIIGPTNFKLLAGTRTSESSFEDMVHEVRNGIITKGIMGYQASNIGTGDYSVVLDTAFKIEKGEITYPVKHAMVTGNILDLLKNVTLFADDNKQISIGQTTVISPTIWIRNVPVLG